MTTNRPASHTTASHTTASDPTAPHPSTSQRGTFARLALPIAATALTLTACNVNIDFDEESVSQTFELDGFDSIIIDAPFDVTVRQGDSQRILVEVGESLLDDLVVDVVDGELRIDLDTSSFNIHRDLVATITVTDLESLHASSASDVTLVDLDVDDLDVRIDEASQVSMSGSIQSLELDMSEASEADLDGTAIGTVALEMSEASSADFPDTVDAINGSIRGASSLDVADETVVRVETSGASSIDRN